MAATGPASTLIEATAVSVGAGMLLGAFFAGLLSLVFDLEREERERAAVMWSSYAGLATAAVVLLEIIVG
jgi:hypothetical protein